MGISIPIPMDTQYIKYLKYPYLYILIFIKSKFHHEDVVGLCMCICTLIRLMFLFRLDVLNIVAI